jgi:hypothetical protein
MSNTINKIVCIKHKEIDLMGGYILCIKCGSCTTKEEEKKIPMRPIHFIILQEIIKIFPAYFRKNRTKFFYSEMWRYAFEKKVFRITIMGETRGGKSEEAQTLAINWCRIFNALYDEGHYKDIDITYKDGTKLNLSKIKMSNKYIHANQSVYLYHLRDTTRDKSLIFGQMQIIDEDRDNPGGIGSFSEEVEVNNLNNIVAKFMQCEIWITPKRFQTMNTPYGLNCMIKDMENKINWSLVYKIEMNSSGLREQNFLGWTGIALHNDKNLRHEYQEKKDTWIEQELSGSTNERANRRMKAIEILLTDDNFVDFSISKSGELRWKHGIEAMKFLVEKAMSEQKIDQFNETEIERIVAGIRALGEQHFKEVKKEVS